MEKSKSKTLPRTKTLKELVDFIAPGLAILQFCGELGASVLCTITAREDRQRKE